MNMTFSVGDAWILLCLEFIKHVFGVQIFFSRFDSMVMFFLQATKRSKLNEGSCHSWLKRMSISKSPVSSLRLEMS